MSDYCKFSFTSTIDYKNNIEKYLRTQWDAFNITAEKQSEINEEYYYFTLTISELNLKECLPILNILKRKFKNLIFFVEYGVY